MSIMILSWSNAYKLKKFSYLIIFNYALLLVWTILGSIWFIRRNEGQSRGVRESVGCLDYLVSYLFMVFW